MHILTTGFLVLAYFIIIRRLGRGCLVGRKLRDTLDFHVYSLRSIFDHALYALCRC